MANRRQIKTMKILMENRRALFDKEEKKKKSVGQAMREAGYPLSTSRNPQQLTRSQGWQEMLEEFLPNERHRDLLLKIIEDYEKEDKIKDKRSYLGLLDHIAKLKGRYPDNKVSVKYQQYEKDLEEITDEIEENKGSTKKGKKIEIKMEKKI